MEDVLLLPLTGSGLTGLNIPATEVCFVFRPDEPDGDVKRDNRASFWVAGTAFDLLIWSGLGLEVTLYELFRRGMRCDI